MKFLPFIDLQLMHGYYADGRSPDFSIEPTQDTQRLLKNYRCILKSIPNGARVLMAVTENNTPFIPVKRGVKFSFQLRQQNPDFALFTDLTEISQVPAPIFTNADMSLENPVQLALASRQAWSTERFTIRLPAQEDHFTLSGRPLAELQPSDFTVEGLGKTAHLSRYDAAAKVITFNSKAATQGDTFKIRYATAPQLERSVFADVEIYYNDSVPDIAAGPGQFQISFNARKARWQYYVIADKTDAQFRIEDKEASPILFSDDNRTDLNEHPDPSDNIARQLAEKYPQMQRVRFVSDDLIPCQQQPRKLIQLRLNGDQILETLPNPSLQNNSIIEINRNGSPQQEDALFQVVKYITHQFLTTGG